MIWRDRMCGGVRTDDVGQRITLSGWVHRRRDHGGLVFIDLRDGEGLCQLVINPEHAPDAAEVAHGVRNEFVLRAEGEVVARAPELVNPNLATGDVELRVDALEVVSTAPALPFQLDEEGVDETLRLRYRWLDLRRDKLQRNIKLRAQMVSTIRRVMEEAGFMDIQTPILFKPTPEGARDFVVPSRLQPGRFYALPQSPQILKQLLVIAGFDRYYQIAVCFRDEDLRADRVQEITQLDVEMAFPDEEFIVGLMERMIQAMWRECIGVELAIPFPRMAYDEAMLRYGTDKPDLRLRPRDRGRDPGDARLGLQGVRRGRCRPFHPCAAGVLPRRARPPREMRKSGARKGSHISSSRATSPGLRLRSSSPQMSWHTRRVPGETVLFCADDARVSRVLGNLRLHLGRELDLVDEEAFEWVWITDFPMSNGRRRKDVGRRSTIRSRGRRRAGRSRFDQSRPAKAHQYDLVGNGNELGGGSFRIHEPSFRSGCSARR